jgi:hypothetical protein
MIKAKTLQKLKLMKSSELKYYRRSCQCVKIFFVKVYDINQDLEHFQLQCH